MYRLFFLRWFPQKWRNSEMAKVISETVKLISEDLKPTFWIHITDFCTIYIIKWCWLILKYQISTEKQSKEAKKHCQIVKTELYKAKLHFKIVKTHFKNTKTHFGKAKTHFDGILLRCPWLDFGQKSLGYDTSTHLLTPLEVAWPILFAIKLRSLEFALCRAGWLIYIEKLNS